MSVWFSILTVLFIVSSIILVLVILVQRPQGGGLAQAFGGASGGGTDTAFGGRTGDVLTYLTMGAFALYLAVAIGLNVADDQSIAAESATEEQVIEPGLLPTDGTSGQLPTEGVTPKPVAIDAPTGPKTEASDAPLVAPAAGSDATPAAPASPESSAPPASPASPGSQGSPGVPSGAPVTDAPAAAGSAAPAVPPTEAPAGKP